MAIVYQSGSIYADATGQLYTGRIKIAYIIFTGDASGSTCMLRDGTSGTAPQKLRLITDTNHGSVVIDLTARALTFNDGIYLSQISANSNITLIVTTEGAS